MSLVLGRSEDGVDPLLLLFGRVHLHLTLASLGRPDLPSASGCMTFLLQLDIFQLTSRRSLMDTFSRSVQVLYLEGVFSQLPLLIRKAPSRLEDS